MTYYLSKVFWRFAAPTSALVLTSGSATLWAVLDDSRCAAWLAAAAACGLVIGAFTPIGLALTVPLEYRFMPSDSQAAPDGIILLGGSGLTGIEAVAALSQDYSKARLIFSGFRNHPASFKIFAQLGGDPARIICIEPRRGQLSKTHFTPPRCSNQSSVKGGCWSLQPCICRGLSAAFELPDFRWSRIR